MGTNISPLEGCIVDKSDPLFKVCFYSAPLVVGGIAIGARAYQLYKLYRLGQAANRVREAGAVLGTAVTLARNVPDAPPQLTTGDDSRPSGAQGSGSAQPPAGGDNRPSEGVRSAAESIEGTVQRARSMEEAAEAQLNTFDLLKNAEKAKHGGLKVDSSTLQQIGAAEARGGKGFAGLKEKVVQDKPATWHGEATGGRQTVKKYIDPTSGKTKFTVHTVTDSGGRVVHRDFDSVLIRSGQQVGK